MSAIRPVYVIVLWALCLNASSQLFEEIAQAIGIDFNYESSNLMGGGLTWLDYDRDGDEDLYLPGGFGQDQLFRNNGDGTFTNVTSEAGYFLETAFRNTIGAISGDLDNDGYREIFSYTKNAGFSPIFQKNILYYNNGDGTFTDISELSGLDDAEWTMSACFSDVNKDGFLDLWTGNYISDPEVILDGMNNVVGFAHTCFDDHLYINNGDLTFTKMTDSLGGFNQGCTLAMIASDYDRDLDDDILFVNDFGEWVVPNALLNNEHPDTSYSDLSIQTGFDIGIYGMGIAVGDYDEDLDLDYYMTNIGSNALMNNAGGVFENVAQIAGVDDPSEAGEFAVGWGTFFFDFDNDSWLDLFVSNGFVESAQFISGYVYQGNRLFRGSSFGEFQNVSDDLPQNLLISRGAAWCDYDKDGKQDFGVSNVHNFQEAPNEHFTLYRNTGITGNYVSIGLEGVVCNRDAFGTQIELYAGGRSFLRELNGGSSHCSQNSRYLHFGLGEIEIVDSVKIFWSMGSAQVVQDIPINQYVEILQDSTTLVIPIDTIVYKNPFSYGDTTLVYLPPVDTVWTELTAIDWLQQFYTFPQPAEDVVSFRFNALSGGNVSFFLYDITGNLIGELWNGQIFEGENTLEVNLSPKLTPGVYLCYLKGEDFWKTARLQLIR